MSNCDKCTKTQKKFRALEIDLQFQIKKLNQDMATLKITLQLAHQKQLKKNVDKINQQKLMKQSQVKCWMLKYDSIVAQYQEQLVQLKKSHEKDILNIKEQTIEAKLSQMKQKQNKILQQKDIEKQKHEQQKNKLILEKSQQKKNLQIKHEQQLKTILSLHRQEKNQLNMQIEKLNEKIKQLLKKSSCVEDNAYQLNEQLKFVKEQLKKVNQELNDKKILLKIKLEMKQKQINNLKEETIQKINKLQKNFDKEKQQIISEKNKKIKIVMEDSIKMTYQFEQKLQEINRIRQNELKMYNQNIEDIKKVSQEVYIPKNRFNEEINTLNVKLINKQKDVQRAKNEVRQCKLQIVNKEDTIIKFFPGANTNYASTTTAPDIFIRSPNTQKKKEYSIKKHHRASFNQLDNSPLLKTRSNESAAKINLNKTSTKVNTYTNLDQLLLPQYDSVDAFSF